MGLWKSRQTSVTEGPGLLLPYIIKTEKWPYSQVTSISRHIIAADLLCHAVIQYPKNASLYAQVYRSLVADRPFFDSHKLPSMDR
jgi:hypothetical protein